MLHASPSMTVGRPRSRIGSIKSAISAPLAAVVRAIDGTYMPDPLDLRDFGLDISEWQWGSSRNIEPDWQIMAEFNAPKIRYVMVRMGLSWGRIDACWERTWKALKMYTDVYRMPYHVIYPSQDVDRQLDLIEQGFELVNGDMGEGPIQEDWELSNDQSRSVVSSQMGKMLERGEQRFGKRFDAYSAAWFMDAYAMYQPWMDDVYWWMAHYWGAEGEHPGPPRIPAYIQRDTVGIHQTGSKMWGAPIGITGSKTVDTDRFELGRLMTLEQYLEVEEEPVPPEPPKPDKANIATMVDWTSGTLINH